MMNHYEDDEFLRSLELEDNLPSTTNAQREANRYRRELYLRLRDKKPNNSGETVFSNLSTELMERRIIDPTYRFSVRSLIND